jgi:ribosomal protein L16 Arg81 hydroxylase
MRTGDVMHIPRGYWHVATRADQGEGYSLHATFGFVKRTGVDWLTWLADHSREQEQFRHDLDRWSAPAERAEQEEVLRALVPGLLARYPQDVFIAAREQERAAHRHVRTFGTFGRLTEVVCVTEFPPHIETNEATIDVMAAGKCITFAAAADPTLRLLLSGNPANLHDVTQTTGVDAVVLAETLVAEGVCAELTAELAAGYAGIGGSARQEHSGS